MRRRARADSPPRAASQATSVDRIQSTSLTSGKNILFFHLSYPPTFEQVDQMDDSRRSIQTIRVSSFNAEHEKVSRWTSTTFAVELASHNALVDVVAKLTATGLPRPVVDNISVQARKLYARWPEVKQFLASLDITVGFQLESLLSTSLLDANQLAELRPTISAILRDHRKQGERILITFATRLSGLVTVKVPTAERAPKKKKGIDYLVLSDSDDSEAEEEGNGDDATFKLINQGQRQASTTFTTVQLEQHLQDSVAFATAPAATTAFEPLDKQGASRAVIITPTRMILQGGNNSPVSCIFPCLLSIYLPSPQAQHSTRSPMPSSEIMVAESPSSASPYAMRTGRSSGITRLPSWITISPRRSSEVWRCADETSSSWPGVRRH